MITTPKTEHRDQLNYVAIAKKVAMKNIPAELPPLIPEVFGWLAKKGITPAGAPFFRYLSMENSNEFYIAVGVPITNPVTGDDRVEAGFFPAGLYATITHTGSYNTIRDAHMALESWLKKNQHKAKPQIDEDGKPWGTVTEFYPTDPKAEPRPEKWVAEVIVLVEG